MKVMKVHIVMEKDMKTEMEKRIWMEMMQMEM